MIGIRTVARALFLVCVLVAASILFAKTEDSSSFIKAAKKGDTAAVKSFLEHGIDVNTTNKEGWTALHEASGYCKTDTVAFLLKHGANVNTVVHKQAPITGAALNGCLEVIKLLIKNGAKVNVDDAVGMQPIQWAARTGRTAVVDLLVKSGANVNARGLRDVSVLMDAASWYYSNVEIVNILIKSGADVNATDRDGSTPLMSALTAIDMDRTDWPETIRTLLIAGARVDVKTKEGTPLQAARKKRDSRVIVQMLKEFGAK